MDLDQALGTYLAVANPGGKRHTTRLYRLALARFAETLGRPPVAADLTDDNLSLHAQARLNAGRARDTVAGEQAKLLALWRFLARRGDVEKWPLVKPISRAKRTPKAWTREEFERLYQATDFAPPVGAAPGFVWWRALLSCLFFTGERISAMLAIEWQDVDLDSGWLNVRGETRKGGLDDRSYQIPAETVSLLRRLPRDGNGPFDCPHCIGTIYRRLKELLERAGLPTDRRSMFHRVRRTTASHYAAAGGNVVYQDLIFHVSSPKRIAARFSGVLLRPARPRASRIACGLRRTNSASIPRRSRSARTAICTSR